MIKDEVAAVVIGRNEGGRLIDCLKSLQTYVKCIVYVDSGSIDGSPQNAEQLGTSVLRLSTDAPFTAARARNEGFAVLKRLRPDISFVQFVDGDCELVTGWLVKAVKFMTERDDIAVVCGRRRERYPSASVYNRLCDIEWDTPIGPTSACGGDSLVRASAFEAVSGFRAQLIAGEEPELCLRLREKGWKIWRLDAEMTRHDAAIARFSQWWRRSVRSGYGTAEVVLLHWDSPFAIWKRELIRSIAWGGAVPLLIAGSALMNPISIAATLIYPLQICRIAVARGPFSAASWAYAIFVTLGKFAEFQGIMKYLWRGSQARSIKLIEYK
jgi:GT2 family glycosyltransferase